MTGAEFGGRARQVDEPSPQWIDHTWRRLRELQAATPEWMWPDFDITTLPRPPAIEAVPLPPSRKFRRLFEWFAVQTAHTLVIDEAQFDDLVDGGLPAGATTGICANEWWTNNPRKAYARAWVNAGYLVTDGGAEGAIFVRGRKRVPSRAEVVGNRLGHLQHVTTCATTAHAAERWNLPTSVYVAHLPDQGLYKVGVGRNAADRIERQRNGRRLVPVQVLHTRYKYCAWAIEAIVLNLTEPCRVIDDRWRSGGALECWSDDGPVPDLREIADRLNPAIALPDQ